MKGKKILSAGCILIGICLIAAALFLNFYNERESRQSEEEKNEVLVKLQKMIPGATEQTDTSAMEVTSAKQRVEMTEVEIDGYYYIGYLRFPTLEDEFPVMSGWDEDRLKIAPCKYYGSVFTNDLVIAGHNYRKGFGKLKSLQVGDTVEFLDMDGVLYCYAVDAIEVLQPTDIDSMVESPWDLSLYTCTYDGKQRYTLRLKKTN